MRIENKKAKFDYEIVEAFEAGIVLTGAEAKSIKSGQANLTGSRVVERDGALWVLGMNVPKYVYSTNDEYEADRVRKLLVHHKEIEAIASKKQTAGLTLIPLSLYNKGSLIKMEVGLVRGRKKYEKRELLKKRDVEKDISRRLKG